MQALTVILFALVVTDAYGQNLNSSQFDRNSGTTITLSGLVKVDDGSPLSGSVTMRVACGSASSAVAYAGPSGEFGFQWRLRPSQINLSNSYPNNSDQNNAPRFAFSASNAVMSDASTPSQTAVPGPMDDCDLLAEYGSHKSSRISLRNATQFEGVDVGIIWLHRIGPRSGNTVSASTLRASKEAKNDFEKGKQLARAGKLQDAALSFEKATVADPGFADAWLELGTVQFRMKSPDLARESLLKAAALDDRMPGTWRMLGYVASDRQEWADAAGYLDHAERLDPLNSPSPWLLSAAAYFNLKRFDEAEHALRVAMKMDPNQKSAAAQNLLGMIQSARIR